MGVLVGLLVMGGVLIGPPPAEATLNSCSLNGTYILSGLGEAAGFLEVVGSLSFTPNGPCTSGTLGGLVTIRHQGAAPTPFTPSGTYSVDSGGNVTASVPGVIDLVGIISLVTSPDQVANSIHLVVRFTGPQVLALTATREAPTAGSITLTGDLNLPATTSATAGVLTLAGAPFLHAFGTANTFLGANAGNFTMTGGANTATGSLALSSNTTGDVNTAIGYNALSSNTTGTNNAAIGYNALSSNTTGDVNTATGVGALNGNTTGGFNTATGAGALFSNTTGDFNTATGVGALNGNTTGDFNTALGAGAGASLTSGDNNIYIGSDAGTPTESGQIRLGTGAHTATFIAGIRGTVTGSGAIPVLIDSTGQLGTISFSASSRRVKTDIQDLAEASTPLLALRPVSFRYRAHADQPGPRQYGLIAEEVAEVLPDLVVYDPAGQPETVRYDELPALLLNELQQQHRELQEQHRTIQALQDRLGQLERLLPQRAAR
jgi:hypothetical protein